MSFKTSFCYGLYLLLVIVSSSCTKTKPVVITTNSTATGTGVNPFFAGFGTDAFPNVILEQPLSVVMLNGKVRGTGSENARVKWSKVSGPASFLIENPDSLFTKVSNLEIGNYKFSLSATHPLGGVRTDTVIVNVVKASSTQRQIIFWGENWVCPMGCSLSLGDYTPYFSLTTPINVFIKSQEHQSWTLLKPSELWTTERFFYVRSSDNRLFIYDSSDKEEEGNTEIKITF